MNAGRTYAHNVRASEEGLPLLELLTRSYSHTARDGWEHHCCSGRIFINSVMASADTLVHAGDLVEYHRPPWREPVAPTSLVVIYQDEDLLIVRKPSGLPVLPSEMYWENTVVNVLRNTFPEKEAPSPVHRLGVGTSGVLLCAISARAKTVLGQALQERTMSKTYRALVNGIVEAEQFQVDVPIGPVPHSSWGGFLHGAVPCGKGAKSALSIVRVVRRDYALSQTLVEVRIPTGRPHQIRIHMAYAGHPLVGDPLYVKGGVPREANDSANEERPPLPRDVGYLLHAFEVVLQHPTSGETMTLRAAPPAELCVEGEQPFGGVQGRC